MRHFPVYTLQLISKGMKESWIMWKAVACMLQGAGLWGLLVELCFLQCVPWQSVCHEGCAC